MSTKRCDVPQMPRTSCIIVWPPTITRLQSTGMRPIRTTDPTDLKRYSGALTSSVRMPWLMPTPILMAITRTMAMASPQRMTWFTMGIVIQLLT